LQRLEVRQSSILARMPPEQPVAESFPMDEFFQALDSGQVGSVGGMDLDTFRNFLGRREQQRSAAKSEAIAELEGNSADWLWIGHEPQITAAPSG
jgi:hypothetical protein